MTKFIGIAGDFMKKQISRRRLCLKRTLRACFVNIVIVFAYGCSTAARYSPANPDYKIETGKKEGLVIVSFGQAAHPYRFYYRPLPPNTGPVQKVKVCDTFNGATLWDTFKTDCCRNGVIFYENKMMVALQLPEGDYDFFYWDENLGAYDKRFPEYEFSCPFKVVAGKTIYAGSFVRAGFKPCENTCGETYFKTGSYVFLVSDNHKKDIPMFKKYFRNIRDDQLDVRIMKLRQTAVRVLKPYRFK